MRDLNGDRRGSDCRPAWFECDDEDVAPERWRGLTFAPVTRDGVPVRSWVLPGDTAADQGGPPPDAARPALFVGDAGLYARANLAELSRGAGRYSLQRMGDGGSEKAVTPAAHYHSPSPAKR